MGAHEHDIRVPSTLKARAVKAKWKLETTVSALMRSIFEEYAAGKAKPKARQELAVIRFTVDDDVWDQAVKRAEAEGVSLAEVAREKLSAKLSSTAGQAGADGGHVVLPTGPTPRGGTHQPRASVGQGGRLGDTDYG